MAKITARVVQKMGGADTPLLVAVEDEDRQHVEAVFEYQLGPGGMMLTGATVRTRPDEVGNRRLSASDVRRLPLSTWERAARGTASAGFAGGAIDHEAFAAALKALTEPAALGEDPTLSYGENEEPDLVRKALALMRLYQVAQRYREKVAGGVADPAKELAAELGKSPEAVRSFIYRARKAGYLGPATGPIAGEDFPRRAEK